MATLSESDVNKKEHHKAILSFTLQKRIHYESYGIKFDKAKNQL